MSEQKDFESRLRDALRADGEGAQVDPRALGKIRGRIAQGPRRRPVKRVIAYGVMAAAAACTAAILVVPLLAGPSTLENASAPAQSQAESDTPTDALQPQYGRVTPSQTESESRSRNDSAQQPAPVIGELTVGKDLRVVLMYTHILADNASVTLSAFKAGASGRLDASAGSAAVGGPDQWTYAAGSEPKLCEFRVTQAPNRPATVRVRLAQGDGCSAAYVYEVDGKTLKPKSS